MNLLSQVQLVGLGSGAGMRGAIPLTVGNSSARLTLQVSKVVYTDSAAASTAKKVLELENDDSSEDRGCFVVSMDTEIVVKAEAITSRGRKLRDQSADRRLGQHFLLRVIEDELVDDLDPSSGSA